MTILGVQRFTGLEIRQRMNADNLAKNLNKQGAEGWELVAIFPGKERSPS